MSCSGGFLTGSGVTSMDIQGLTTVLKELPVGQAVLGALVGLALVQPPAKQVSFQLCAVARGAVQGSAALGKPGSQESEDGQDPIEELEKVLVLIQKASGSTEVPKVEDAKTWLRDQGAGSAASMLGKLSSLRNMHAHAAARRVTGGADWVFLTGAGRLRRG